MHFAWLKSMSPEDIIGHYEKMERFWKKAGNIRVATRYANKAKRIREEMEEIE